MKVAFRCDASAEMGMGHLMRCLTLADELRQRGAEALFIIAPNSVHHRAMIETRGFPSAILDVESQSVPDHRHDDPPMAHWLPWGWKADADATRSIFGGQKWDWIVADHYAIDHRWHESLRASGSRILAIDDTADRDMAADVLLDHNASATAALYRPRLVRPTTLLLGPAYALIRPENAAFRKDPSRQGQLGRIIVTFGGATSPALYRSVAQALATLPIRPLDIELIGIGDPEARAEIVAISDDTLTVSAYGLVNDMPARYASADLCIGAAGVSALERALIGIPSLTYVTAANQRLAIEALVQAGAIVGMGDIRDFSAPALVDRVLGLTYMPGSLAALAENGQRLVPGGGPKRVADIFYSK